MLVVYIVVGEDASQDQHGVGQHRDQMHQGHTGQGVGQAIADEEHLDAHGRGEGRHHRGGKDQELYQRLAAKRV
ncbi:MAG: hypothetical protein V9H69_19390 [Anaerolineae bacterium]